MEPCHDCILHQLLTRWHDMIHLLAALPLTHTLIPKHIIHGAWVDFCNENAWAFTYLPHPPIVRQDQVVFTFGRMLDMSNGSAMTIGCLHSRVADPRFWPLTFLYPNTLRQPLIPVSNWPLFRKFWSVKSSLWEVLDMPKAKPDLSLFLVVGVLTIIITYTEGSSSYHLACVTICEPCLEWGCRKRPTIWNTNQKFKHIVNSLV